jgi:cytochrome c peroxidase
MKQSIFTTILFIALLITACDNGEGEAFQNEAKDLELDELLNVASNSIGLEYFKLPSPSDFDNIPQDPNNPITTEKVLLGRLLFHETAIGINPKAPVSIQSYSCASCHNAKAGFQACMIQGLGDGGQGFGHNGEGRVLRPEYTPTMVDAQAIRTPSSLNTAYQKNMLWNGQFGATGVNVGTEALWTEDTPKEVNALGFEGVETQAIAGLGVHRMELDNNFIQNTGYKTLFDAAFPNDNPMDRYSLNNAGLAIAAYERTIVANQSPFQEWVNGTKDAMTLEQKEGAILFFGKAGCVDCHSGPALNDMDFHALGMKDLYQETSIVTFHTAPTNGEIKGRGGFTGNPDDDYKFKTPQLYNLKDSPFYGHGGSFRSVEEVIRYKNTAIAENENVSTDALSNKFVPLNLTDDEIAYLVDFIENGLHDPNLMRYQPNSLPSEFCTPNNDAASRADVGCN